MFSRQREQRFVVDGVRVECPMRGPEVDIDECTACGKLLRVVVDDDPPYFVCTVWPPIRVPQGSASSTAETVIRSTYCSSSPRDLRRRERHRDE